MAGGAAGACADISAPAGTLGGVGAGTSVAAGGTGPTDTDPCVVAGDTGPTDTDPCVVETVHESSGPGPITAVIGRAVTTAGVGSNGSARGATPIAIGRQRSRTKVACGAGRRPHAVDTNGIMGLLTSD